MKILMENWKKFLLKENVDFNNLCLYIKDSNKQKFFILYNPESISIENLKLQKLLSSGLLLAMIATEENDETLGKCFDARNIIRSASNNLVKGQGIGLLLYQIAMSFEDSPITGDRSGTSDSAKQVYGKLPAKTKDFDNVLDPKTEPKEDDCYVANNTINKAYWINDDVKQKMKSLIPKLINNHKNILNIIQDKFGYNESSFEANLYKGALGLFTQQYTKNME